MIGAGVRAGIIMGIVAAAFALAMAAANFLLAGLAPLATCCSLLVIPALWFVSGILATRFAPAVLTSGTASAGGAVAGAITQTIGGVVETLATLVVGFLEPAAAIPPETMRQLTELGLSPQEAQALVQYASGPVGAVLTCVCCAGAGAVLAAGLGALGGIVGRATKK
jgi:hypothetical protein